jgi:Uma2 family endonuclease
MTAMSVAEPPISTDSPTEPRERRFTRDEYYRMAEAGLFEGQRVQLIAGKILAMTPQKREHATAILLLQQALIEHFGSGVTVRPQLPLKVADGSEPEPDLAVVAGSPRDYDDHPSTALLIVEVSDTTLAFDRSTKASLYASANVGEYWVLNLGDRRLEAFRQPVADEAAEFGHRYHDLHILGPDETVTPVAAGSGAAPIKVADLLP